jgi:triose/dihydroxyacetone kinase / FAD-AMP lyase (cyclizing)
VLLANAGIHNEPGHEKVPVQELTPLIESLLDHVLVRQKYVTFATGASVVLFVNNLGGVSNLEMGAVNHEVNRQLATKGIRVVRMLSGTYMTSLGMNGISVSLSKLDSLAGEVLSYLDHPTQVPCLLNFAIQPLNVDYIDSVEIKDNTVVDGDHPGKMERPEAMWAALESACNYVIEAEPDVTRFDTVLGTLY